MKIIEVRSTMKKVLFETSLSKIYILIVCLVCMILLGSYFSYAMFTVSKEKSNAISIITGNLTYELLVNGEQTNKLIVSKNDTKSFTITLSNPNNRMARFNFYYLNSIPDNVMAGYLILEGTNIIPDEKGVNLEKEGTTGSSNVYKLIVSNNTENDVSITLGVEVGLDYNDLTLPSNGHLFLEYTLLASDALKLKANASDKNYDESSATEQKEMWTFSHETTIQTEALTDYRYIGNEPNNYVEFNSELWRIIGVFTVDDGRGIKEERLKIMRGTGLDEIAFDNSTSEDEYGSNNWVTARVNYLLNEGHENESVGGSLYWNQTYGTCYNGINNGTSSCDFTATGLLPTSKNMIANSLWYIGGIPDIYVTTLDFYNYERGNTVFDSTRQTTWIGKVALIYPSDYGFATSGNETTSREECLNISLANWISDCYTNNWFYQIKSNMKVTITPYSLSSNRIFHINSTGYITTTYPYYSDAVFPTVYLKHQLVITDGTGSQDNPYKLELINLS